MSESVFDYQAELAHLDYQRQLSGEGSIPGCYCRDCKWWKRYDKPMPQWEGWGYCQRVHEPASICLPDPETYELGIDAVETDTDVSTRGDFGCVQAVNADHNVDIGQVCNDVKRSPVMG